ERERAAGDLVTSQLPVLTLLVLQAGRDRGYRRADDRELGRLRDSEVGCKVECVEACLCFVETDNDAPPQAHGRFGNDCDSTVSEGCQLQAPRPESTTI